MCITSLRQILSQKGINFNNCTMNWKQVGGITLFWKEKLLSSDSSLAGIRNKILDAKFDDAGTHPFVSVFTAEDDYMEITITFKESAKSKMTIHIDYQMDAGEFSFNESFH